MRRGREEPHGACCCDRRAMPSESLVRFRTLDGLHLAGTSVAPDAHEQGKQ
jgi:hypothetical protein